MTSETRPKSGEPGYNAWKVRQHRARKKILDAQKAASLAEEASIGNAEKMERLRSLIQQARSLAAEINAEIVAELKSRPQTKETLRLLLDYEDRESRVDLPRVGPLQ